MATRQVPASVGQRLLWHLEQYRGGEGGLNCPVLCRVRGPLHVEALREALDGLSKRHEALRTTFERRARRVYQLIHPPRPALLEHVDLSSAPDVETALDDAMSKEIGTPIDAMQWPSRTKLWHLRADDHVLCLNMHHLVSDGRSGWVVLQDLAALYARARGDDVALPSLGWQYAHFAEWQRRQLDRGGMAKQVAYWTAQLDGAALFELPSAAEPPGARTTERASVEIDRATTTALREIARHHGTSPFVVMLALHYLALTEATQERDLSVASVFANRARPEVQRTVGFLANVVMLRAHLDTRASFESLVPDVHRTVMDAFVYQGLPYHMLPSGLFVRGARRPDDVVFQMIAEPMDRMMLGDAPVEVLIPERLGSRFVFELLIVPTNGAMRALLLFDANRVDRAWATGYVRDYVALAEAVAASRRSW